MHILRAREFANVITDGELKVLKRFRASFDFNKIIIPGPYVLALQSIGIHVPGNKRFLSVIPAFPVWSELLATQGTSTAIQPAANSWSQGLGFIPYLIGMCSIIATKQNIGEEAKMKKHDDSDDVKMPLNFSGRFFVPFHRDRKNKNNFLGYKHDQAPDVNSADAYFALGSSFHVPFPDSLNHLKNVYEAVPPVTFPSHTAGRKVTSLMELYNLDKDVSFFSVLFEALAIEARFFEGMTTFENIDVETGAQLTCVREVTLEGPSLPDGLEWFQPLPVLEDGITTTSRVADIGDTDLQLATYSAVISRFSIEGTAAHAIPLGSFDSTKAKLDSTSTSIAPIFDEGKNKRQIPRQNPFVDEIRTHIYTSMMYDLSEVL